MFACANTAPSASDSPTWGEYGGFPPTVLDRADLQRLVDAGLDRQTAPLLDALVDVDAAMRATAAYALASVQDPGAAPALVTLLEDPDAAVRRNAAFALGQLGDATIAPALLAALINETDSDVRLTLLEAAGKSGAADALADILDLDRDVQEERGLALALYHFARRGVVDTRAAPTLLALLHVSDARTRYVAALAMAVPRNGADWGIGPAELRSALDGLPADGSEAGPLLDILARSDDDSDLARLLRWLADAEQWTVRTAAATAIGEYAGAASSRAFDALVRALDDPSPHVATAAAGALVALSDGTDPGMLAEWIRAHPERPAVGAALLPGLVGSPHESLVIEWASGSGASSDRRSLAWPALARVAAPEADSLLVAGLLGARREVYVAAAALAQRLADGPADTSLRSSLIPLVSHRLAVWGPHAPGSDVRGAQRLIRVLAEVAPPQARALLDTAAQHRHPEIRSAAAVPSADASSPVRSAVPLPARRLVNWSLLESSGARPCLAFTTSHGTFTVELYPEVAPLAVSALIEWAADGMYDGLTFHRVEPDFILQSGDYDNVGGFGGPERGLRSEFTQLRYAPGVLGIASSGKDTEGSQFFITHNHAPSLDGRYGAVGRVTAGQDIADRVALGDALIAVSRCRS